MKLKTLFICVLCSLGTIAYSQDRTATATSYYYVDSLKTGTLDTVDVSFTHPSGFGHYKITAWSGAADTLTVWILTPDGENYIQHGVYNQAAGGAAAVECVTSTTKKDWIVLTGPQVPGFRFMSPGSTNDIHFIVSGQRGAPVY